MLRVSRVSRVSQIYLRTLDTLIKKNILISIIYLKKKSITPVILCDTLDTLHLWQLIFSISSLFDYPITKHLT
jgi:hypothetical protein